MIKFSIFDYILFACTLGISTLIGVYYAIRECCQKKKPMRDNATEFLMGGRKMPLIPTALSLLVSFVSGISMLSYPSEVYKMGTAFCWMIIGCTLGVFVAGVFILPVVYPLPSMSIYAYLEQRFNSRGLRLYGSIAFQLTTLAFTSVALYAPSIALAGVTGMELWMLLVIVGAVCTLYTSIGGLKAVVWTDAFQAAIMYAGLLAMAIKGTLAVGGIGAVFETAQVHGRFDKFLNIDPNPLQYMTVWIGVFGGLFYGFSAFGANQIALQRYCSLPTLGLARAVVFVNGPLLITIMSLIFYIGLAMFAYSAHCLWRNNDLDLENVNKDQLVIYYMLDLLGGTYGLPGLYVACIFSATLSTVSSSINSLSAVLFEDFIQPLAIRKRFSQRTIGAITKVTSAIYGLIAVGMAFAAGPLGGILKAVTSAIGALSGPLVGLILLGILFPCANRVGAIAGVIIATGIDFWIFIGAQVYRVQYPPLNDPSGCLNGTVSNITRSLATHFVSTDFSVSSNDTSESHLFTPPLEGVNQIYALSFVMHSCVGAVTTIVIGLLVSLVTGCDDTSRQRPELVFWIRHKIPEDSGEFEIGDELHLRNNKVASLPDLRKKSKKRSVIYEGL